jgi:hypothetical protein
METMLPQNKDISVFHLNTDWGYIAYIEKKMNDKGEFTYEVIRVPLGDNYIKKRPKRRTRKPTF